MAGEVKSAEEATKIAQAFIAKLRTKAITRPIKASREDDIWIVKIDIGAIFISMATIKIDAKSGAILEYDLPS